MRFDFHAFAIENMRREFIAPSLETLLETAIKNAERWTEIRSIAVMVSILDEAMKKPEAADAVDPSEVSHTGTPPTRA